ncbi:MAG: adenine phosphoribosyltransferase [Pseudomonadota bacterium]
MQPFKQLIRDVRDWPTEGVTFKDISPLLAEPAAMRWCVDQLAEPYRDQPIDRVVGIESRGFIFAVPVAAALGVGFVPARKPGKLPGPTLRQHYDLEYGQDAIEIQVDAIAPGQRVLVIDDVLATGGTLSATGQVVQQAGASVVASAVLIELSFLNGRALQPQPVHAVWRYSQP